MLADPVEAFLTGMGSGVLRYPIAFLAVLAGFTVSFLAHGWNYEVIWAWVWLSIGLIFWWGTFGAWFLVGLMALISIFVFSVAFAQDRNPKLSLFLIFSAAVVYFSPLCFGGGRWMWTLCLYGAVSFCYWVLPGLLVRLPFRADV